MSDRPIYRGMGREALNAAYNNLAAVEDSAAYLSRWSARSEIIRKRPGALLGIRYGAAARTLFDYLKCGVADAPLLVFIHGGYWQRNHKDMFAFIAEGPLAAGFDVAMIGYTLAPQASLSSIVEEVRMAARHLADHATELGFCRDRVILSGWSAGAHLAAMFCNDARIRGVLAVSGIFDLEPIALCYINDALRLSSGEVERLSPIKTLQRGVVPLCAVYGDQELPELQRQSAQFVETAETIGRPVTSHRLSGHHHFSILDEFAAPDSIVLQEIAKMVE